MMKAANSRQSDNMRKCRRSFLRTATDRRVEDSGVDSLLVIVVNVFVQKAAQVPLVDHDHVIE